MPSKPPRRPAKTRRIGRPGPDFSAQEQILYGAAEAFGTYGFADTSVADILAASGVSRRTFYRLFRNKDEVFEALFESASDLMLQTVTAAVELADTPYTKVEAGIEAFLRVQAAAGPLARVLTTEPMLPGSKLAERHRMATDKFAALFQTQTERLRRRVDPLLLRGLVAALEHVSMLLQNEAAGGRVDIERGKRVMLRIVAASLALPGEPVPDVPTK